jgi:hypothetical protein
VNNTNPSSLYFLHNSGPLMEFLFKGMLYCKLKKIFQQKHKGKSKDKCLDTSKESWSKKIFLCMKYSGKLPER